MSQSASNDNLTESKLLFHVLREHRDLTVRNAAKQGNEGLQSNNLAQTQNAITDISEGLKSWEVHPALAKQMKLASNEINEQLAANALTAPDVNTQEVSDDYRPMDISPSM